MAKGFGNSSEGGNLNRDRRKVGFNVSSKLAEVERANLEAQRLLDQKKIMGNNKYINEGRNDRLSGFPYDNYHSDIDDRRSYDYGFLELGSRTLVAKIEKWTSATQYTSIIDIVTNDIRSGVEEKYLKELLKNKFYKAFYSLIKGQEEELDAVAESSATRRLANQKYRNYNSDLKPFSLCYYGYMYVGSKRLLQKIEELMVAENYDAIREIAVNDANNNVPEMYLLELLRNPYYSVAYEETLALREGITNPKIALLGANDRVEIKPYDEAFDDEDDKKDYNFGYMVLGTRRLIHQIKKLMKDGNISAIEQIAENDVENDVPTEYLEALLTNPHYKEAYEKASANKKKKR